MAARSRAKVGRMGGSPKGSRGAAAAASAILPLSPDLRVVLRLMGYRASSGFRPDTLLHTRFPLSRE